MIQSIIRMTIPSQKHAEAVKIISLVAEQCRAVPGCLSCHFYGDLQEKDVLMLTEVWSAEEAMNLHLRSEDYRNLLLVLEMSLKPPEIRFDVISSSRGMKTIEKARIP
jgi:quinol monooxygenase YgiN